jgi:Protein of unknown function DUF262/Protein of unknown function (DUF1524)
VDITPRHETIAGLFGPARIFRVPKYQRHYAWSSEEIEDLKADLDRSLKARKAGQIHLHFFGGLVTVARPHTGSALKLEVIDGQQRLATFVLLVAQLIRAMKELAEELSDSSPGSLKKFLLDRVVTLEKQFLRLDDTIALKVENVARLEISKPDYLFFVQLIEGQEPDNSSRESHKLLKVAYSSLGKYLDDLLTAEPNLEAKVTQLANVAKVLEVDWTVIHMETTKLSYAYNLFQVLNNRGVGLTEGELLRAKTLETLDGVATQEQMDRVEACWDDILSEAPGRVEEVLRWIFASHTGYRPGKTTLFDEFLGHLIPAALQPLTSANAKTLVSAMEDLRKDFKKVALMLDGQWPYPIHASVSAWDRDRLGLLLRELKHTNCMPLLIAGTNLGQKAFSDVVQILERFVFRYRIVANAHIGPATSVYNQQAVALRASPTTYKLGALRTELKDLLNTHASDSRFATNLGELQYSTLASNKAIKYLLMTLEHYARWYQDGAKGSPVCKDKSRVLDFANTTLEHLHPQKATHKSPHLEALVNALGNLTILGPSDNNAAGNKPFSEKQPILAASTISLNNRISSVATWDAAAIAAWQEELKAMALKVFVV